MKRIGLISTCILLFALSLYIAYMQGSAYGETTGLIGAHLAAPTKSGLSIFWSNYLDVFAGVLNALSRLLGRSLMAAVIVLALLVELITLYPAVNLQLKQKKIHVFHKKLVDRFHRGELTMSESKHELDVLYSVNERIHRRGAMLIGFQMFAFVLVFAGLQLLSEQTAALSGGFSSFNHALLSRPVGIFLPLLAGLAYLLHSLVKIQLKQREDYIDARQVNVALGLSLLASALVFYFASVFAVLLTVYFLTQLTFATMRYIVVEENAKAWGKYVRYELIRMLRTSRLHRSKVQHLSRKFHHLSFVRQLNFHLLEEALSMSLIIVIALNGMALM